MQNFHRDSTRNRTILMWEQETIQGKKYFFWGNTGYFALEEKIGGHKGLGVYAPTERAYQQGSASPTG